MTAANLTIRRGLALDTGRLGVAPYALSYLLAADVIAAALGSLVPGVVRGPAVSVGSLQGMAVVMLAIAVPVLLVSLTLARSGSAAGMVGWLGAVTYLGYQGVLFLFGSPFNALFLLYVGVLSLSAWSLIALLPRVPVDELAARVTARMPVRALAVYLIAMIALFDVQWLRAIVPAMLDAGPPAFLEGTGMTTGPGQVLDLGFFTPLILLTAWLTWHRRPWGLFLTGGLLVMAAIETVSIAADQWLGHAADPSSPVVSADIVPVFAVLAVVGLAAIAAYARGFDRG